MIGGLAGFGLLTASAVHAQWDRGFGWRGHQGGMGMERDGRFGGRERGARFSRFCASDAERFAPVARVYVKADLRLNAEQSGELDRLADVVLPGLVDLKREVCNDFATRGAPTPDRLAELADNLRKAADLAQSAVEPAQRFYGTLDAGQKARVDQLGQRSGRMDRQTP
jgi:hypothetical protein